MYDRKKNCSAQNVTDVSFFCSDRSPLPREGRTKDFMQVLFHKHVCLYSDIGKVPSDSGIFGGSGELREYEEEVMGLMGQVVEERRHGARPLAQTELN